MLSTLPSSLPALRPIASLFASNSSSAAGSSLFENGADATPTKLPAQQRKRKRDHESWAWGRLTVGHVEAAFGVRTGLALEGGQEGKKLLLVDLKDRIRDCKLSYVIFPAYQSRRDLRLICLPAFPGSISDGREAEKNFCRHLPMALFALCGALHTSPPALASSTPTRTELKELTTNLRSIPIAVGYALASLAQNVALPTKARVTVFDVLALTLGRLYVTGAGEPLKAVEINMEKAIARGLESTERSIRMAARLVPFADPPPPPSRTR